jgi:hypothetical protein
MSGVSAEVLPDIGRIVFENGYVDKEQFLVLELEDIACVVWALEDVELRDVMQSLTVAGMPPSSVSPKSVVVQVPKERKENLINAIHSLAGDMR